MAAKCGWPADVVQMARDLREEVDIKLPDGQICRAPDIRQLGKRAKAESILINIAKSLVALKQGEGKLSADARRNYLNDLRLRFVPVDDEELIKHMKLILAYNSDDSSKDGDGEEQKEMKVEIVKDFQTPDVTMARNNITQNQTELKPCIPNRYISNKTQDDPTLPQTQRRGPFVDCDLHRSSAQSILESNQSNSNSPGTFMMLQSSEPDFLKLMDVAYSSESSSSPSSSDHSYNSSSSSSNQNIDNIELSDNGKEKIVGMLSQKEDAISNKDDASISNETRLLQCQREIQLFLNSSSSDNDDSIKDRNRVCQKRNNDAAMRGRFQKDNNKHQKKKLLLDHQRMARKRALQKLLDGSSSSSSSSMCSDAEEPDVRNEGTLKFYGSGLQRHISNNSEIENTSDDSDDSQFGNTINFDSSDRIQLPVFRKRKEDFCSSNDVGKNSIASLQSID
uniref:Uncharacterized protein n=1 Tax=Corethron hystrix TaxID=216773 RepID=A0A7S1FXA2_9STRA